MKEIRPIKWDKKGIAVYSDSGIEQARYNPHYPQSANGAQEAAWQAVLRGDISKTRYIAFMSALESHGVESVFGEREAREIDIQICAEKAVGDLLEKLAE